MIKTQLTQFSVLYTIQEIETESPKARIYTANFERQDKTTQHNIISSSLEPRAGGHGRLSDGLGDELAKIFASLPL